MLLNVYFNLRTQNTRLLHQRYPKDTEKMIWSHNQGYIMNANETLKQSKLCNEWVEGKQNFLKS